MNNEDLRRLEAYIEENGEQTKHFLIRRPVGEDLSLLFMGNHQLDLGCNYFMRKVGPALFREIEKQMTPEKFAEQMKVVLGKVTALDMLGSLWGLNWGRVSERLEHDLGYDDPMDEPLEDYLYMFDFVERFMSVYRDDGNTYPMTNPTENPFGPLRILSETALNQVKEDITTIEDKTTRESIRSMIAFLKSLAYLLERDSREGIMTHGPYPINDKEQIVLIEFDDLACNYYWNKGLPWKKPQASVPYSNLAVALRINKEVHCEFDMFNTMYTKPEDITDHITGAAIYTREGDEWLLGPLKSLEITENLISEITQGTVEIHEELFLDIAEWTPKEKILAGTYGYAKFVAGTVRALKLDGLTEDRLINQEWWALMEKQLDRYLAIESPPVFEAIGERIVSGKPLWPSVNASVVKR
jgi:hypothetical protein